MIIRGLGVRGLSGLEELRVEGLDRVVRIGGPPRARQALFEALRMACSMLDGSPRLPWSSAEADEHGQLELADAHRSQKRLTDERTVKVRLDIELDPPLFGRLRETAVRDPEIVDHLGADVTIVLGWAFTATLDLCAASVLSFRIGDFVVDSERPWRAEFLKNFQGRGGHVQAADPVGVEGRATSSSPAVRARHRAAVQSLSRPPFSLPALEVVRSVGPALALGEDLVPLDAAGSTVEAAVALGLSVHSGVDVLLADRPSAAMERPRAVRHWVERQATDDASPLEQVFLFGEPNPNLTVDEPREDEERPVPVLER